MKYIRHTFKTPNNELENWKTILGGKIVGNTLYTMGGSIKEYKFDTHSIIVIQFHLAEEITTFRIISSETQCKYYPIIFSDCLTFDPKDHAAIQANYTSSLSTGIYFSNENVSIQYPKEKDINLMLFRIPYTTFQQVLPPDHSFLHVLQVGNHYHFYEAISMEMKVCIQKILHGKHPGHIERELIKAQSWELFLLFIERFFYIRKNHYYKISQEDQQKLHQVKEFILSDLSTPKNITELVSFCGMSATKLRSLFKEVYGMSIYTLFQEHRMEKACRLLLEGNKSVSEVAYDLGYTHLGHFTEAFKKRFHCLPKNLQKTNWKQ